MPLFPILLATALALTSSAQEPATEEPRGEVMSEGPAPAASEAPPPAEAPAGPMSLEDARINFQTVVESYLAERSRASAWLLKQKGSPKPLRLKLLSIDGGSIKPAGPNRYSGSAAFKELSKGRRVRVLFTVDFSSEQWKVAGTPRLERR